MATIRTGIELQDNFTGVFYSIINAVNSGVSAMENLQQTMNAPVDAASFNAARDSIDQATLAVQELEAAMQEVQASTIDLSTANIPETAAVEINPVVTQQPVIDTPEQIEVPRDITVGVTPVVTKQPDLNIPESARNC